MDKTLQSLYLRLDSTHKSLTKSAVSQLLIKIIYASNKPLKEHQIIEEYKNIIRAKDINKDDINNCLSSLVQDRDIILKKGKYYLSNSKRDKINFSYQESEIRKTDIIETYFEPFFSKKEEIKDWLEDITVFFFQFFSDEWIAELCFSNTSPIARTKDSILETIKRRTLNNSQIDKRDKTGLSEKFVRFITTKDTNVDSYLWEYGTASFSAQLINNTIRADEVSIETFKDSKCVLDTNILMNIGLESSEYYNSLRSLEDVFETLNIKVGLLHITKEEYKNTVGNKSDEILRMVENFQIDVIREAEDQYIKTAIARACRTYADFERFFSQLLDVPEYIDEKISIELFDHDVKLEEAIIKSQSDENKQNELNSIFHNITGRDKKPNALIHDVGLIAGVDYLREQEKCFILSQDISVNNYAKQKPLVQNLPIAIRLETIINVLAVNNGGVDLNIDTADYIPLFASMIRNGLTPSRDTFKIADLSLMLEKNEQIAQLPKEDTIRIAKEVNRKRLLGESEEKIALEMTREIQGVKIQIVGDLEKTKMELTQEQADKDRYKEKVNRTEKALRDTIKNEVETEFRRNIKNERISYYFLYPVILMVILVILFCIYHTFFGKKDNLLLGIIISLVLDIIGSVIIGIAKGLPKIRKLKKDKNNWINNEVEIRLKERLQE